MKAWFAVTVRALPQRQTLVAIRMSVGNNASRSHHVVALNPPCCGSMLCDVRVGPIFETVLEKKKKKKAIACIYELHVNYSQRFGNLEIGSVHFKSF